MRFAWDLLEMCIIFAKDFPESSLRFARGMPDRYSVLLVNYFILCDWITEWLAGLVLEMLTHLKKIQNRFFLHTLYQDLGFCWYIWKTSAAHRLYYCMPRTAESICMVNLQNSWIINNYSWMTSSSLREKIVSVFHNFKWNKS